jgi:hypothetical protein
VIEDCLRRPHFDGHCSVRIDSHFQQSSRGGRGSLL